MNAAPGPYEVAVIIDEEGKARGRNGERWVLIRNADGAIASVYPAREAEATAQLLAASWNMLKALRLARAVAQDEIARLQSLEAEGWDAAVEEAKAREAMFDQVIKEAEATQ